jgi:hypothetical protein
MRKASIYDLEQLVKEFRRERDYRNTVKLLDKVDGLKPRMSLDINPSILKREQDEGDAMENHESMFRPIEPAPSLDAEIKYVSRYGIEQYIEHYKNRHFEGLTCLRDPRYLKAQLLFLESYG